MKIIKDFRNDLLKRQEVSFSLEAEKNPNFNEMKKQVSEQVGKPEENIDVYNIKGGFGSHEFKIDAYVYDSKKDLEKFVQKKKKEAGKKEVKVEEAKEEKSAEKTGAPVEEKSEQVQEKPESKPTEAPVEERAEQEQKAVGEHKQAEEEVKEP